MGNKQSQSSLKVRRDTAMGGETTPALPEQSFAKFMLEKMAVYGDSVALVDGESEENIYTYSQVIKRVYQLAGALQRSGVRKGHVICILSLNNIEYPILYLAVTLIGAIFQPLNPVYTADDLYKVFEQTGTVLTFTSQPFIDKVKEAKTDMKIVTLEEVQDFTSFEALIVKAMVEPELPTFDPRTMPAVLFSTSGTTGFPKAAQLSHQNCTAASISLSKAFVTADGEKSAVSPGESVVAFIPLCHVFGLHCVMMTCLLQGLKVILMPCFSPQLFLELIQKYKAVLTHIVPPVALMLVRNLLVSEFDLSSLRFIVSGAAQLPTALEKRLREKLPTTSILQGYGMTEMSVSHCNTPRYNKPGSCGRALPGIEVKVVDVTTRQCLGPGQQGELCIKGPQVMIGYLNQPEATKRAFDEDGWLLTGDLARVDEDGYVFIVDRLKELIKYKTHQVPPVLLEDLLLQHPVVADAAVIGVPDDEAGELPLAFIVCKPQANTSEDDITNFVAGKVAPHMQLRGGVEFIDAIPKNPSGKIMRRKLRQMPRTDQNYNVTTHL